MLNLLNLSNHLPPWDKIREFIAFLVLAALAMGFMFLLGHLNYLAAEAARLP